MAEDDFQIQVKVGEHGTASLEWHVSTSPDRLRHGISAVSDDALLGRGLRRLEITLPASDRTGRRAALMAGYRQEGVRRAALQTGPDTFADVVLYARLTSDQVEGPASFSGVMNSVLPRKRCIAHVLMHTDDDRVLLCDTRFADDWALPGGVLEDGEAPRQAAQREVRAKLGVEVELGPLLVVDWMPAHLGWDDALEFVFDGGTVTEADLAGFHLLASELLAVHLVDLVEASRRLPPLAHRRLIIAHSTPVGTVRYLERGQRI